MLGVRAVLAIGMVVIGCVVIVRMLSFGLTTAIVPGIILGGAMVALGLYRFKQIRNAGKAR